MDIIKTIMGDGIKNYVVRINWIPEGGKELKSFRLYQGLIVEDATDIARIEYEKFGKVLEVEFIDEVPFSVGVSLALNVCHPYNDIPGFMHGVNYEIDTKNMIFRWSPSYENILTTAST